MDTVNRPCGQAWGRQIDVSFGRLSDNTCKRPTGFPKKQVAGSYLLWQQPLAHWRRYGDVLSVNVILGWRKSPSHDNDDDCKLLTALTVFASLWKIWLIHATTKLYFSYFTLFVQPLPSPCRCRHGIITRLRVSHPVCCSGHFRIYEQWECLKFGPEGHYLEAPQMPRDGKWKASPAN